MAKHTLPTPSPFLTYSYSANSHYQTLSTRKRTQRNDKHRRRLTLLRRRVEENKKGLMLFRKSCPAASTVCVRPMIAGPWPVSRLARTRNEQELA
jgi:hypothetical protein